MEEENRLEKTIQTLGQKKTYFDVNEQNSITPLSKQLFCVISFCELFQNQETKKRIKYLEDLYRDPIAYVLKNYNTGWAEKHKHKIAIKKTLGQLEYIFYRDTKKFTPLNKEYNISARKPNTTKVITFDDLSAIRGYVEMAISSIFNGAVIENNVELEGFNLPELQKSNNLKELME